MRTPALDAWREEVKAGTRLRDTFDWLWRAACAEANALEFKSVSSKLVARCLMDAQHIVKAAARQSSKGVA